MRALLLLALLPACADLSAPELPPATAPWRTLCLAQPEYIEVLEDAASEWEAAIGRDALTVTTERVPGCTLVTYMHELSTARAGEVERVPGARELVMHLRYDAPYTIVLHELGHVLGLDHVPYVGEPGGRESIMNEGVGSWSVITEEDAEAVK